MQTLAFLESTFGGVANIKRLSMAVKSVTGGTHRAVTKISPWGGRLLSEYGGAMWRAFLAPAVRNPLTYFQGVLIRSLKDFKSQLCALGCLRFGGYMRLLTAPFLCTLFNTIFLTRYLQAGHVISPKVRCHSRKLISSFAYSDWVLEHQMYVTLLLLQASTGTVVGW